MVWYCENTVAQNINGVSVSTLSFSIENQTRSNVNGESMAYYAQLDIVVEGQGGISTIYKSTHTYYPSDDGTICGYKKNEVVD